MIILIIIIIILTITITMIMIINTIAISIYKLDDVDISRNLIGSLSLAN